MENNTMRIICNPYTKEITYQWLANDTFTDINDLPDKSCSELINEKFTKTAFQNRAFEIVEIINNNFNSGTYGFTIDFIGNREDYDVLENVVNTYFSDKNITCHKNELHYLEASDVMAQIKERFSSVIETLENNDYAEENISAEIAKYKDTIDESIAICVTGLYSAGKSAFINSLIGYEILPCSSDPTTAKVFRITDSGNLPEAHKNIFSVSFGLNNAAVSIKFEGEGFTVSNGADEAFINKLNDAIALNENKNEVTSLSTFISCINKETFGNVSEMVDIFLPFNQATFLNSDCRFMIYDTPGSGSDSNPQHFEILKKSLGKQTNALLVLLTTPDTMDNKANNELLELIDETGKSLDTSNAIIVVNKSDSLTPGSLNEKRERYQYLKVTKWKSTRIFFLSSVIAMGSKKSDPEDDALWMDKDAYEIFDEKCRKFARGDRKLSDYNIIDKSKNLALNFDESTISDATLFVNSGLASIEHEISDYARRYALCNKCSRATDYLQKAIQLCEENVRKIEKDRDEKLSETQTMFQNKHTQLAGDLDSRQSASSSDNTVIFAQEINERFNSFKEEHGIIYKNFLFISKLSIYDEFKKLWDEITKLREAQNFEMSEALSRMQSKIKNRYNSLSNNFSEIINDYINSFWKNKEDEFKAECRKIIMDSDALNDEQKAILNADSLYMDSMTREAVNILLVDVDGVKKTIFGKEKFDNSNCCKKFLELFDESVNDQIKNVIKNNSRNYEEWSKALVASIKTKLCTFNSELRGYEEEIAELNHIIEEKRAHIALLSETRSYVCGLLDIQS